MLIIFGGLPGVGKSTIAKALARKMNAFYIRIDSLEQAFKSAATHNEDNKAVIVAEGYYGACAIAKDNLAIGHNVIVDSVNPIDITRQQYRDVAIALSKKIFEVEIICSDKQQHKQRIEQRKVNIPGIIPPTWDEVQQREYQPWHEAELVIDTAITDVDAAVKRIMAALN